MIVDSVTTKLSSFKYSQTLMNNKNVRIILAQKLRKEYRLKLTPIAEVKI